MGAEVEVNPLRQPGSYPDTAAAEYTGVVPGNAMKFTVIHPAADRYDFREADLVVNFAQSNGQLVRGVPLVWHNQLPSWVTDQLSAADYSNCSAIPSAKRESIRSLLHDHLTTLVSRYRGQVAIWDVVNEAFDDGRRPQRRNTIWQCALGPSYIDSAFVWARRADPDARLFYNDYGAEGRGAKADSISNLVRTLKSKGIPIGGVGLQLHGALATTSPTGFQGPTATDVGNNMDDLISLGIEVQITEMDIKLLNPSPAMWAAQGRLFGDMLGVCLARPKCTAFVTWGFTDLWTWDEPGHSTSSGWTDPLPFDKNYVHKPAFDSLLVKLRGGR